MDAKPGSGGLSLRERLWAAAELVLAVALVVGANVLLLEGVGPKSTLYFWVDDIDSAYAELRSRGIEFTDKPHLIYRDDTGVFGKPGEEEWLAFFSDPSGNVLALATRRPGSG